MLKSFLHPSICFFLSFKNVLFFRTCPDGIFSPNGTECLTCTPCMEGTYIIEQCSPTTDTKCASCPDYTFTNEMNSGHCNACSDCPSETYSVVSCNPLHDVVCRSCPEETYWDESSIKNFKKISILKIGWEVFDF